MPSCCGALAGGEGGGGNAWPGSLIVVVIASSGTHLRGAGNCPSGLGSAYPGDETRRPGPTDRLAGTGRPPCRIPPRARQRADCTFDSRVARLSPITGRIGRALSDAFNSVVAEESLGWPEVAVPSGASPHTLHTPPHPHRASIPRCGAGCRPLGIEGPGRARRRWVLQATGSRAE